MKSQRDRLKNIRWLLLAVVALAPPAVFSQQNTPLQGQQDQSPQAKTEETPKKTEAAETKTEETGKQTEAAPAQKEKDAKVISGMSILGNQEAPKALVIVPWKSSELGNALGITTMLDDSKAPVDKEVFMRMLSYYEIRSETPRPSAAPAEGNAAQSATAALRRKQ